MSYQVLARKYRPHSFEELVGQEHVVQALANALTQQRLHHAYLFTGTRGVGKTTVSRILAKSLNCTGPDGQGGITATPCRVCAACRDIDAGRFVDYVELDAASNRGVEEISQLLDQSVYKPVMGRFKVYMIDEVHMLSNTAFNAMLKTLEEPPDYLKFVLATTDPQKVPVTVLSRCLQFNLRPMAPQTVLSHLTQVLQAENVAADAGSLRLLSRAARGSMRDALSLTDQAIAFGAGALVEDGVRQMLGTVDRGHVVAILEALIAASGVGVVAQADALRGLGLSAAGTLEDLAGLLQQMAVAQVAPGALDDTDPDTAEAQRLSAMLPADEIQLMYSMALHGRQELALAPDEYAGLLMVLLRMLSFRPQGAGGRSEAVAPAAPARVSRGPQAIAVPQSSPSATQHLAVMPQQNHAASQAARPAVSAPAAAAVEEAPPEEPPAAAAPGHEPAPATRYTAPVPTQAPMAEEAPGVLAASVGVRRPLVENGSGHSARLRPRAVVRKAEPEPEPENGMGHGKHQGEPPPWLDVPMGDGDSDAFARTQAADDALDETQGAGVDEGQAAEHAHRHVGERRAYRSTAGADVLLQPTPLGELWAEQIGPMGLVALTRELAVRSQCVGREEDGDTVIWRLRVERESLRQEVLKDKLQAALEVAMQRQVLIELEAGVAHDSPALRDAAVTQARQREVEQIVIRDPLAQALMAQFKTARIVPGSIKSH